MQRSIEGRDRHHEHCVGGGSAGSVGGVREGRRKGARGLNDEADTRKGDKMELLQDVERRRG